MVKMMSSKEMYAKSPKLSRGEDGKMGVHDKSPEKNPAEGSGETETDEAKEGMPVEANDVMARHNLDRHMMHAKHEHEHATHKGGGKEEMHKRHMKEHNEMLKRHEVEMGEGGEEGGRKDMMEKGEQE